MRVSMDGLSRREFLIMTSMAATSLAVGVPPTRHGKIPIHDHG
jgi:hypothetical protein